MKRVIVYCVFGMMVSIVNAGLLTNGDIEQWTAGEPDGWQHGSATVAESTQLNGTLSAQLTAQTGVLSSAYYFRQVVSPSTPISDSFSVAYDFAFEAAGSGERHFNVNLQNVTTQAYTVLNLKYEGDALAAYNGSSWQTIDSSGLLTASDFGASVINPYRLVIEGNLRQTYSLSITDLSTNTVIFNQSGLNHWQIAAAGAINTVNLDLSRGNNAMLVDNFTFVPEPATLILLGAGTLMALRRRK